MNKGLLIGAFICALVEIVLTTLSIMLSPVSIWLSFSSIVVGLSVPFLLFMSILK
jgi:hypothetical protein